VDFARRHYDKKRILADFLGAIGLK
jgi:hypothetical protein